MIDTTKTYKTRSGCPARFLAEIKNTKFPLIFAVMYSDGQESVQTYTPQGGYYSSSDMSEDDLVEYDPWKDLPVDTPVYVRDDVKENWIPRYFSHMKNGRAHVFTDGATSFSSDGSTMAWDQIKLKD